MPGCVFRSRTISKTMTFDSTLPEFRTCPEHPQQVGDSGVPIVSLWVMRWSPELVRADSKPSNKLRTPWFPEAAKLFSMRRSMDGIRV